MFIYLIIELFLSERSNPHHDVKYGKSQAKEPNKSCNLSDIVAYILPSKATHILLAHALQKAFESYYVTEKCIYSSHII